MIPARPKRLLENRIFTGFPAILLGIVTLLAIATPVRATPQFARTHQATCAECHVVPPMLNENGLAFQASGYEWERSTDSNKNESRTRTIPMAVWISARQEDQGSSGASDLFLPKVELISGGRIGSQWSYFVEWRIVSMSLNADGSLKDRGGRFEDLFFNWNKGRHSARVGQYRTINQVDVSLRLSPSDPLLFKNGLRTGSDPDPRLDSLNRFSPSSRSPSLGYSFQSITGKRASDGLFHFVTVPFVGEFSIPLSEEASQTASFELAEAKGVYVETFYRRGQKTLGGHAFIDGDGAWLLNALATMDWRNMLFTAGVGVDDEDSRERRNRGSVQAEYLFTRRKHIRGAAGLRIEDVSDDGKRVTYVPYIAVSAPDTRHTFLLQLQYKNQEGSDAFVADLSVLF